MKIIAQLHIGHRSVTWRDTTSWTHLPEETFNSSEALKAWIHSLHKQHFDGNTHVDVNLIKDDGSTSWFQIYYKNFGDFNM